MRIRNPPTFIMSTSLIMSLIMTLLVFQCAHPDDARRWRQKQPGGAWSHGHGRVELAGWEPARWADQAGRCAGPAG